MINGTVFGATGAVYDFQNQARKVSRQSFGGVGDTTFEMATTSQRYREVRGSGETILFGPGGFELITAGGVTTYRHELGPIVVNTSGGTNTERYALRDRLGSTMALSPPDQSVSDRRAYDPYGKVRNGDFTDFGAGQLQLTGTTFRGFTEHEHVDNLQLIHMNGRLFDYHLGRFYQVDPMVQFPTNSQSLNPYSYLMNNPFAGTDPSGYCQKDLGSNICSQGEDVTVTATYSSGKTQNLGTYNTNKSKDIAQARGVKLGGNGAQSMSSTGAGGLKEQAAGAADKGAMRNAQGASSKNTSSADQRMARAAAYDFESAVAMELPSLPQEFVDSSAGIGDSLSFGLTRKYREWVGIGGVDVNSFGYDVGYYGAMAPGAGRLAYALSVKTSSVIGSAIGGIEGARFASQARNIIRVIFRGGGEWVRCLSFCECGC